MLPILFGNKVTPDFWLNNEFLESCYIEGWLLFYEFEVANKGLGIPEKRDPLSYGWFFIPKLIFVFKLKTVELFWVWGKRLLVWAFWEKMLPEDSWEGSFCFSAILKPKFPLNWDFWSWLLLLTGSEINPFWGSNRLYFFAIYGVEVLAAIKFPSFVVRLMELSPTFILNKGWSTFFSGFFY